MSSVAILSGVQYHHVGQHTPILSDIEFTLAKGEVVALIGPSGAGKSTLLSLLDGRLQGWSGAAIVLDEALSGTAKPKRQTRADTGFVFQEFALIERASVRQNVLNGRLGRMGNLAPLFGRFSSTDEDAVDRALRDAGITELADKRADQLSGGQRQRVAIARCLAQDPKLILADEPVSNLDPARAESILHLITGQANRREAGVVFTSHQPDLALGFADRVVGLKDGRISFDMPANQISKDQIADLYHHERPATDKPLRLVV